MKNSTVNWSSTKAVNTTIKPSLPFKQLCMYQRVYAEHTKTKPQVKQVQHQHNYHNSSMMNMSKEKGEQIEAKFKIMK